MAKAKQQQTESPVGLEPRSTPIADGEWVVTIQLQVNGKPVGTAIDLSYGDAYAAKQPRNVGYLIARAINERARSFRRGSK